MKTKFTMILTLFMALIVQLTFAQQKTVTGTVSDENGLPLIGATVVISGTSSGTTTDFDGNYRTNARQGEVLNFSYVGYETQVVKISTETILKIILPLLLKKLFSDLFPLLIFSEYLSLNEPLLSNRKNIIY